MRSLTTALLGLACVFAVAAPAVAQRGDSKTVRVFVFAGQSNMEGADSKVPDIERFPPYRGLGEPQPKVRFRYVLGRDNKERSEGWVSLQPARGMVGPELAFARKVRRHVKAPLAIIKVAAGGTHLGGDWNPDEPTGFKLYPLLLQTVREALADLDRQKVPYRVEGFCWHQGENDMFNQDYQKSYGKNLANFVASVRRDLKVPKLRFYVGELCTKTIWGMDLRPRMYAISLGQKEVAGADPLVDYVPTSHVGVEIGGGVGLHYHYGTLGQLQHGENYADAYLRSLGVETRVARALLKWPYRKGGKVRLFVFAGHRNMEGERAFVQDLVKMRGGKKLARDNPKIAFRYSLGGGVHASDDWEPLGPAGLYDTFGPELAFAADVGSRDKIPAAIAKFTHSGSQIIDWTPAGSVAKSRNLYPQFVAFVRDAVKDLERRGHDVELAGIFYHVGENDMSWGPFRRGAPERLEQVIQQSRKDLGLPKLRWFVTQQPPTDDEVVNGIDVTADFVTRAGKDPHWFHEHELDLPPQAKKLVLDTPGVLAMGRALATLWSAQRQ